MTPHPLLSNPARLAFLLFALAIFSVFPSIAMAQGEKDINVSYESLADAPTIHGYAEHRFVISNKSRTETHTIQINLGADTSGDHIRELTRSVVVPPQSSAAMTLYQPAMRMEWDRVRVSIDGSSSKIDVGATSPRHGEYDRYRYGYGTDKPPMILVSRDAGTPCIDAGVKAEIFNDPSSASKGYSSTPTPVHAVPTVAELPVQAWPTHWLAYSRFDGVIMNADEFDRLPAGALEALTRYVELGGRLLIHGMPARPPTDFHLKAQPLPLLSNVGFGTVLIFDAKPWSPKPDKGWSIAETEWRFGVSPYVLVRTAIQANTDFPVIDKLSLPSRGLLTLIILFTLLVGPANFMVLSRMGRKIWMLWTVPAISLLASVLIFLYASFGDGWQGQARTAGITFLDGTNQHASTLAWTGYYSPLTPSAGLNFSADAELSLQAQSDYYDSQGKAKSLDWTTSQHLYSGWITARVPAHFEYRKSETRRERITIQENGAGEITVINGLGAPIKKVYVRNSFNQLMEAQDIPEGASAGAMMSSAPGDNRPPDPARLAGLYARGDWFNAVKAVQNQPRIYMPQNGYIAILDGNPFVEEATGWLRSHKKECVVIGTFSSQDAAKIAPTPIGLAHPPTHKLKMPPTSQPTATTTSDTTDAFTTTQP